MNKLSAAAGLEFEPAAPPETLELFAYKHLPPHLAAVSEPFCTLAHKLWQELPPGRMRQLSLEHLLIAKDRAVNAVVLEAKRNGVK